MRIQSASSANPKAGVELALAADRRTISASERRSRLAMSASRYVSRVVLAGALAWCSGAFGGFDHKVPFDESGIWDRDVQKGVQYTTVAVILGSALWEGGQTQLGRTSWQAVDSTIIGAVTSEAAKRIFSRARPSQTDDPGMWFEGSGLVSFPSGEVTLVSAAVAPYVF